MSVLVDWQIKNMIEKTGEIKVDPYDPTLVNPASLDIRLSEDFSVLESVGIIDPTNPETFSFKSTKTKNWILLPGETVLAGMLEKVSLSENLGCKVMGKSSLGRLALLNSSHAGWTDPSWSGVLTMEISNLSKYPIKLTAGMKIGQLVFYKTEFACRKGYDQTGRYQNQESGMGSLGI